MELRKRTAAKVLVDMYTAEANLKICDSVNAIKDQKQQKCDNLLHTKDSLGSAKDSVYLRQLNIDRKQLKKANTVSVVKSYIIIALTGYVLLNLIF